MNPMSPPLSWRPWAVLIGLLGGYFLLVLAATQFLGGLGRQAEFPPDEVGARLALCLIAMETVALAAAVPFLIARSGWPPSWRALLLKALAPVAAMAALSVAACAIGARGSGQLTGFAWAQCFLVAFSVLLGGLFALGTALGCRAAAAQAIATLLALAMVGNVFYANVAVEETSTPQAKRLAIDATLWTNPWLIAGGTILQADPLRSERLYSFSRIPEYAFRYPAAGSARAATRAAWAAAVYGAAAAVLWALAGLLAWRLGAWRARATLNPQAESA